MSATLSQRLKRIFIGKSRDLAEPGIFHHVSLIALFAWVGLGADGLSSSCYGPAEVYKELAAHPHLSLVVALASVATVMIISASYTQIIELFPTGGGGYLVASKLLNPYLGVVSGCALLVDYVLTISISIASGADALFSMLPAAWQGWKLATEVAALGLLLLLNLRGVKESVAVLAPIFFAFIVLHAFAIIYVLTTHAADAPRVVSNLGQQYSASYNTLGLFGMLALITHAYSMGAGTYTGIEAVSNGLPILREPRVVTGKHTMRYMAFSLAITVAGLIFGYVLLDLKVQPDSTKTLNAVLFENISASWPQPWGWTFVAAALASEAALLFIAAQAGFLDGPRVLASMALDRWMPNRFATLSDRLVNQNGILLMGLAALLALIGTHGSVDLLVVLYSINVFITFSLSQLGMVRHWWGERKKHHPWRGKMLINGTGLVLTTSILVVLCITKFHEGGWITIIVTGLVVAASFLVRHHYDNTRKLLGRLDNLVNVAELSLRANRPAPPLPATPGKRTAVILVNGFNGLGLHTVLNINRIFSGAFGNFVFVMVGVVDSGNFKGEEEIVHLRQHIESESQRYVRYMHSEGFHARAVTAIGTDAAAKIVELAPQIMEEHPDAVFFAGQLVFPTESVFTRWLHNYLVFSVQRALYSRGWPLLILPIRV